MKNMNIFSFLAVNNILYQYVLTFFAIKTLGTFFSNASSHYVLLRFRFLFFYLASIFYPATIFISFQLLFYVGLSFNILSLINLFIFSNLLVHIPIYAFCASLLINVIILVMSMIYLFLIFSFFIYFSL